jgi:hypothetical protein
MPAFFLDLVRAFGDILEQLNKITKLLNSLHLQA